MDVFGLRDKLIQDYTAYTQSFIQIQDSGIQQYVQESVDSGALWPKPLIQLNPSFEPGEKIDDLVRAGVLHPECQHIFQKDKDKPEYHGQGRPLQLHKHQSEAVRVAAGGHNYVLTTGTGSGKSLAYIIPIVDHVLRRVRDALNAPEMQCVGTSATLAGVGSFAEQREKVAEAASLMFGAPVRPEDVIGETLRRATDEGDVTDPGLMTALRERLSCSPRVRPTRPLRWPAGATPARPQLQIGRASCRERV